jgi:hypothetical protein
LDSVSFPSPGPFRLLISPNLRDLIGMGPPIAMITYILPAFFDCYLKNGTIDTFRRIAEGYPENTVKRLMK